MVVAQVVRIRNYTKRQFRIDGGDPFYTTRVNGEPLEHGSIDVFPGCNLSVEGLVVPWASMTVEGLVITETGADQLVRCVVGPKDDDSQNYDFLRWHSASWEPVHLDGWTNLGKRHIMGTIGTSSDWQITFKNDDSHYSTWSMEGAEARNVAEFVRGVKQQVSEDYKELTPSLENVVQFERAAAVASPNTVYLNVYDLAGPLTVPNAILCNTIFNTIGAFHAAVEVYGEEWSFYRTPRDDACGVHRSARARQHSVHVYRQSIDLGKTNYRPWEVRYLIQGKLAKKWLGGTYDLLHRNCIHFSDELALSLGVRSVPTWVRGLHETGAAVFGIPWPWSFFIGGGTQDLADEAVEKASNEQAASKDEVASQAASKDEVATQSGSGDSTGSESIASSRSDVRSNGNAMS